MVRQVIVFDAADLHAESAFWAGVFGGHVFEDDDWHSVIDAVGQWRIGVQLAPDHVPPDWPHGNPQQVHLDLHVDDFRAAHDEVITLGARLLRPAPDPDAAEGHQVYADPAGHPFCIGWGQPSREQLAAYVADRLGRHDPMGAVEVELLADAPHLIEPVGRLRFAEWGHDGDVDEWIATTRREAGRDDLPVTWVAVDETGAALGAVALGPSDVPGRPELMPCVWGMVVRADLRGRGIGRLLLQRLERFAVDRGHPVVWVLTGPPAVGYYERCGWQRAEELAEGTLLRKTII